MVGVGILACSSKTALLKTDDGAIAPTVGTGGAREGTGGARGLGGAGTGGSSSWEPDAGPSQDPVLQACLLAASCGAPGTSLSPSACIAEFGKTASRWDDTMLNHLLSCAGATSCSELRSCWGGDLMTLSTVVYNGECIGNVISVELIAGVTPAQFDCGAIGGECAPMASGSIQATWSVAATRIPSRPATEPWPAVAAGGASTRASIAGVPGGSARSRTVARSASAPVRPATSPRGSPAGARWLPTARAARWRPSIARPRSTPPPARKARPRSSRAPSGARTAIPRRSSANATARWSSSASTDRSPASIVRASGSRAAISPRSAPRTA